MSHIINKPDKIDWWIITIYWLLAAPFIIYSYQLFYPLNSAFIVYLFNVVVYTSVAIIVVFWMLPTFFNRKKIITFFLLLTLLFTLMAVVDNLFFSLIFPDEPPLSIAYLLESMMTHGQQFGILGAILVGKQFMQYQQKYLLAEKEKTAAELKLLKAQINPHFLFNNLNVLGALIQQDQKAAATYLKRFAALYRYLLTNKENDTVLLSEELSFIEDYIFLLKKRFGKAYDFQIQKESVDTNRVLIIPAAIQTLIENAVKHNQGAMENPLKIHILIGKKTVMVTNEIRPKFAKQVPSTGTGLDNLSTRYQLLTQIAVKINQDNGQFLVILPLIKSLNGL